MWTKHLKTDKAKKDFEVYLRNSSSLIERLKAILTEKLEVLEKEEFSLSSYDTASWAYKQAHINGAKAEIQTLLDLFNFTKDQ